MLTTVTWRMAADISIWYAPSGVYVHACQTRSPFSAYPIQRPGALVRRAAADLTRAPRDWPLARPPTVQTRSEKRIAVTCVSPAVRFPLTAVGTGDAESSRHQDQRGVLALLG
jgi:hypothetical protein